MWSGTATARDPWAACVKADAIRWAVGLGVLLLSAGAALAQPLARSTRDGVFSAAQAERGEEAFRACSYCHGRDMRGGDDPPGPALKGEIFLTKWRDHPLLDLFTRVAETMPRDRPGTLEPQVYADILAHLMRANGMPAGERDLAPEPATLRDIVLTGNPLGSR